MGRRWRLCLSCLGAWILPTATMLAAETLALPPETPPAEADLQVAAWLAGQWEGEGFGGRIEEAYSAPRAGSIVGYFRWSEGDQVRLYELCAIVQEGATLVYRVKHFDAAFEGWEERERYHAFALVRAEPDALYFDGLTLRRTGPETMESIVRIRAEDGSEREETLRYRRVTTAAPPQRRE
jgi:hypothetical protein